MFLCLSIQNDNQNKLFWKTEAKMRFKNVFVTFLPSFTGLQWTVHENKALYLSPGRVKYERFSIFQDLWETLSLGTLTVTWIAVTEVGDGMFWWQLQDFGDGLAIFVTNFHFFLHAGLSKDVLEIAILSPTFKNCRQLQVTNIKMSWTVTGGTLPP